jgi:hypothetical protein
LQEAFSQIGISVPQVDHRIYLDASFEIINIQKILYNEILLIIQELLKRSMSIENGAMSGSEEDWKNFAKRLQISIKKHLHTVKELAESTHYGRHLLLINAEILEFDLKMLKYQLKYPPNKSVDKALQERIIERCGEIKKSIFDIFGSDGYINSGEEFKSDIYERLNNLVNDCDEVKSCAENSSNTLSLEERLGIRRAMQSDFNSSGA